MEKLNKISFGLVVHNNEEIIKRCLDSIAGVADEILMVHDGECQDKTLDIARKYTDSIFIQERLYGSDPHRIFLLKQVQNQWVFMIDADEYLSQNLINFLMKTKFDSEKYASYAFKWPMWDGKKYVTYGNFRPCLFNKEKCWAIGLHNFSTQSVGNILKRDEILEHKPLYGKIGLDLFNNRLKSRIERDANQYMIGYENLEKYNEHLIPEGFKAGFINYLKNPVKYAIVNFFKHFLGSYKNNYKDGFSGFKVSLQLAIYQYLLAITIWKMQKNQK